MSKKRYETKADKQKAYRARKKEQQEARYKLVQSPDHNDLRVFKGPDPK